MIQKCSLINVTKVFFEEPTKIHFIKEISRKIKLAPTSVRNHIKTLKKEGMVVEKKSSPFNGLVANRESEKFIYYKKSLNLLSLFELKEEIVNSIAPKAIILIGSYSHGEDIEISDIDLIILSKIKKEIPISKFEKKLKRKIHLIFMESIENLDKNMKENAKRGIVLYGGY